MHDSPASFRGLTRLSTGVPGLDVVLGGGLFAGDAYLVVGAPGTGKTTLGNQFAFAHAAAGRTALVATLVAESHERMLAHLHGLAFADPAVVGSTLHYFSFLDALATSGPEGVIDQLWQTVRDRRATLVVIDGAVLPTGFDAGRFVHRLRAMLAFRLHLGAPRGPRRRPRRVGPRRRRD